MASESEAIAKVLALLMDRPDKNFADNVTFSDEASEWLANELEKVIRECVEILESV